MRVYTKELAMEVLTTKLCQIQRLWENYQSWAGKDVWDSKNRSAQILKKSWKDTLDAIIYTENH